MKRTIAILFCIVFCLSFSACAEKHEHVYSEANCISPAVCEICGKKTGKTGDHVYAEATCEEPETCIYCGETIGEALGHDFAEASYTAPETCVRCGETRGEQLPPFFKEKGLDTYTIELSSCAGGSFPYTTRMYDSLNNTVSMEVSTNWLVPQVNGKDVEGFKNPAGLDADHYEASYNMFDREEGYEWIGFHGRAKLNASNYNKMYYHGFTWFVPSVDYYTGESIDLDSTTFNDFYKKTFSISYNGQVYDDCIYLEDSGYFEGGSQNSYIDFNIFFRVPVDYDGITVGFINCTGHDNDYLNNYFNGYTVDNFIDAGVTFVRLK